MTKQINEATVNLDITDLSSSDLQTLSQILSLAGTAENSTTGAMGSYSPMKGPDAGAVGGSLAVSPEGPDVIGMSEPMGGDLAGGIAGDVAAIELGSTDDVMSPGTEMGGGMDPLGGDALGMPEENPEAGEASDELGIPGTGSVEDLEADDEFLTNLEGDLDAFDPDGNGIPGDQRDDAFGADDLMGDDLDDEPLGIEDESDESDDASFDDDDEQLDEVAPLVGMAARAAAGAAGTALANKALGESDEMKNFMEDLDRLATLTGLMEKKADEDYDKDGEIESEDEHKGEEPEEKLDEAVAPDEGHKGIGQIEDDVLDAIGVTDEDEIESDELEDSEDMMESLMRLAGVRNYGEVILEAEECTGCDDENCSCNDDKEQVEESIRMMPNLDLDEDAVAEMGSLGSGANKLYGPYKSSMQAETEAKNHIGGGTAGVNFKIVTKPDGVYWCENVNEDVNRPAPEDVCTSAIRNNRHEVKDKEPKLGDNTMKMPVTESTHEMHTALNEAFAKFMGK